MFIIRNAAVISQISFFAVDLCLYGAAFTIIILVILSLVSHSLFIASLLLGMIHQLHLTLVQAHSTKTKEFPPHARMCTVVLLQLEHVKSSILNSPTRTRRVNRLIAREM